MNKYLKFFIMITMSIIIGKLFGKDELNNTLLVYVLMLQLEILK